MATPPIDLTEAELREGLSACLAVPRWVEEVAAAGPFGSLAALLDVAGSAATPLSPAEIDAAMADHPRIGEQPSGPSTASAFSRVEQQASASDDETMAGVLAAGNVAYERKFNRVFLIRAAGRSRADIIAELQRRLQLDAETERANVAVELREIALLRIPQLFSHLDAHSGYDASDAAR